MVWLYKDELSKCYLKRVWVCEKVLPDKRVLMLKIMRNNGCRVQGGSVIGINHPLLYSNASPCTPEWVVGVQLAMVAMMNTLVLNLLRNYHFHFRNKMLCPSY